MGDPTAPVYVLTATGVVDNIMAGYIEESVKRAADDGSPAIIVMLNTPGGSLDSTQRIDTALLKAPLPTIVYVAPSGGRAASAGTFITMSAALAYMAPGTNIGAASPVGSGGQDLTGTEGEKVKSDAMANIHSIATARGHNADWAVSTVEKAVSTSATEAVSLGAVNGIAVSVEDVQRKADGQVVEVNNAPVTVTIADAPLVDLDMNPFQSFLHLLSDPNIAFILLTIGFYGLLFELIHPNFVTGILGSIALILAFIGFGSLPVNVAGVLLIGLAVVLFLLEITVTSHGLLAIGGLICFVLGAFALYTAPGSPTAPDVAVASPLIVIMAALTARVRGAHPVRRRPDKAADPAVRRRIRSGRQSHRAHGERWRRQDDPRASRCCLRGRRGMDGAVRDRRRDPAGPAGPRRRAGWHYPHRGIGDGIRTTRCPAGPGGSSVTAEQVIPAAIVAVILILVLAGIVRAAGRRRGANEQAFGAGGVTKVPLGTTGVAQTPLAPSGVVYLLGEQWTARSRTGVAIPIGRPGHGRRPRRTDPHRRRPAGEPAGDRVGGTNGSSSRSSSRSRSSCWSPLLLFFATVKIVNQYERILVFTLGRTSPDEVKGPGWVLVVPIVQRGIRVDLREQFIEVPSQTSITKDNAPISIDFLIYWRIVEPYKSVVEVQNFNGALQNIATTTLRAVVGDILLDDVLSKREQINEVLRLKMDEVTEPLGRQGHDRRDPRDHAPARRPGRDEPPAVRRANPARRYHRIGRQPPVGDQRRRGREAVRDPSRRGRPAGRDPARRRVRRSRSSGSYIGLEGGPEDDGPPVPRDAQVDRGQPVHQVRPASRGDPARRGVPRVSPGGE